MAVNLLVAIIVTSCVAVNNKMREGFESNDTDEAVKQVLKDTIDSVNEVVIMYQKK